MNLDFTLKKYIELCEAILDNYEPMSVLAFLEKKNSGKFAIMRHDVDRNPERALKMAKLEEDLGIKSTYYFRMKESVFVPKIIREIVDMGHEVGYHYEVLDKAKGDFEKAIEIFEDELRKFREVYNVKTICMHGNPLTKWVNRDIWRYYDFEKYGITGEPYLLFSGSKTLYLSDTSRKWNSNFNVKDYIFSEFKLPLEFKSTNDIINIINSREIENICVSTHPNRWSNDMGAWVKELLFQSIKNIGKAGIKYYRGFSRGNA